MAYFNNCTPSDPFGNPISENNTMELDIGYTLENATEWFDNLPSSGNATSQNLSVGSCNNQLSQHGNLRYRLHKPSPSADPWNWFNNLHPGYTDSLPITPDFFHNDNNQSWWNSGAWMDIRDGMWFWERGECACTEIPCNYTFKCY